VTDWERKNGGDPLGLPPFFCFWVRTSAKGGPVRRPRPGTRQAGGRGSTRRREPEGAPAGSAEWQLVKPSSWCMRDGGSRESLFYWSRRTQALCFATS